LYTFPSDSPQPLEGMTPSVELEKAIMDTAGSESVYEPLVGIYIEFPSHCVTTVNSQSKKISTLSLIMKENKQCEGVPMVAPPPLS
jgi:hypothetical protein